MKDLLNKIEVKVDRLDERLDSIDKTLAINTEHLALHMARTEASEKRLAVVEKHVLSVNAVFKVVAGIVGLAGFLLVVLQIMGLL